MNNAIIEQFYYPMLANLSGMRDNKIFFARWDKMKLLSDEEKAVLISEELAGNLKNIFQHHGLQQKESESCSFLVGSLYLKELDDEEFLSKIDELLKSVSNDEKKNLIKEIGEAISSVKKNSGNIKKRIYDKVDEDEELKSGLMIHIPLVQALKQFPKIGEQLVTNSPLKIKVFPMPVRPSIKNWINNYHENLGMEKHGSIERGNFVFHSENAKQLSSQERQKLALILKSLEEETLLAIDTEKEEIDFEASAKEETPKEAPPKNQPLEQARITRQISSNSTGKPELKSSWDDFKSRMEEEAESDSFKFSSVHKFPSERGHSAREMAKPIPRFATKPEVKPEDSNPKIQGNIVDLRN